MTATTHALETLAAHRQWWVSDGVAAAAVVVRVVVIAVSI